MNNPWGLTEIQCQVLAAMVSEGSLKGAAATLGFTDQNCSQHMRRAMTKMAAKKPFHALLKWDRWVISARRTRPALDLERINLGLAYRLQSACWRKAA